MWSFYKALLKNPRSIGSVLPSSKALARKIAAYAPVSSEDYVLELGAGTGVITKALLQHGIAHHRIIIVENSEDLAQILREHFPQIKVIQGNAKDLFNLVDGEKNKINAIVSSLPLLVLRPEERDRIIEQIAKILNPGAYYIQYTYGIKKSVFEKIPRFKKIATTRVWWNIPPARIDVFRVI